MLRLPLGKVLHLAHPSKGKIAEMKATLRTLFALLALTLTVGVAHGDLRFEQCRNLDAAELRSDINRLTKQTFETEAQRLDLARIVELKWLELGMPNLIETQVNGAVDRVKADTSILLRFTSSWSTGQAEALAERVAILAFGSEEFRSRVETLASEVSLSTIASFEAIASRSASASTLCLQQFIGRAYGAAISSAFEQELTKQVRQTGTDALTQNFESTLPVRIRPGTAGGVALIIGSAIARKVTQRIATRISRRIAGNIAARVAGRAGTSVVPVVGWVVGGVLVAWDVVDGTVRGPFPTIRRQLTSEDTQAVIRNEIVTSVKQDLPSASTEIAEEITSEVYLQWRTFEKNFQKVLTLANQNSDFGLFLSTVLEDDFYKLAKVADVTSQQDLLQASNDGQLEQVLRLPETSLAILSSDEPLQTVLAWSDVAGSNLNKVAGFEIYRHKSPSDFTSATLERLLKTDNLQTISKLIMLDKNELDTLTGLSSANLNRLADGIDVRDFQTLAWYQKALEQDASNLLISLWLERPSRAEKFQPMPVRTAIAESREPETAVQLVGSEPEFSLFPPYEVGVDVMNVLSGDVTTWLFFEKYNILWIIVIGVLLLLLLLALFLMFGSSLLRFPFRVFKRGRLEK